MALTETKCRHFWIALSGIFILLSVLATAEQQVEGHRCYWCGPLAEQVHRSQRASSCDGDINSKITVCDDGLPYCAIVASSPPYVESRFCVKVYQDECYTLYCNSTKTWRITCPCRGELCNGNNTKRESEAFQALLKNNIAKLTQNKRLKRAIVPKKGFIGMTMKKEKNENTTVEIKDVQNDTNANIVTNETNAIITNENQINNTIMTEPESVSESSNITSHNNLKTRKSGRSHKKPDDLDYSGSFGTDTSNAEVTSNESNSDTSEGDTSNESSETESETESGSSESNENTFVKVKPMININEMNEPNIQINMPNANIDSGDLKADIIVMSTELPKNDSNNNDMSTTTDTKHTTVEHKLTTPAAPKKQPAAEALQHNETPTTKAIEQTTTSFTTEPTMPRKNAAVQIDAHVLAIVIGIILHY